MVRRIQAALILSVCGWAAQAAPTAAPPNAVPPSKPAAAPKPSPPGSQAPQQPKSNIDWPAVLGQCDLIWNSVPASWDDAPFIGNGNLGATIHKVGPGGLAWEVNRTDVTYGGSRYPMGHLGLQTGAPLTGGECRLDLWNAEATGTVRTSKGEIHWRSFVAGYPPVVVVDFTGVRGEAEPDLVWLPVLARPGGGPRRYEDLRPNEDVPQAPSVTTGVGTVTSTQRFPNGSAFSVVLRRGVSMGQRRVYYLGVGKGEGEPLALAEAQSAVERAASMGIDALTAAHRKWWHDYYPLSFVSVPDARLNAFYWIQIYKLGSAMRPDGPIADLLGPWFNRTSFPHLWWNGDTEFAYAPLFTANRLPLAESLFGSLDRHRAQLIANVPAPLRATAAALGRASDQSLASPVDLAGAKEDSGREVGNLTWVSFLYWQYYRYQMDDAILRDRVLPLLSRAVGYYLSFAKKGADGRYHLPRTYSPELTGVSDANYDLALFRWGLGTLVASCDQLHMADPRLAQWREVLANLAPYPRNNNGLMLGQGRPFAESYRHYSHLLAIYPLHLLTPDRPADRRLMEDSLRNWVSRPASFRGFSYTGAASIYATLGSGDQALDCLHTLLDKFVLPNTFSTMNGGPMLDTPISGITSLQEMLLQSWGGRLRIFPAVPQAWGDAWFSTLRAEGAFLVSASRHDGHTEWVKIQSLAGGPCRLTIPGWTAAVVLSSSNPGATRLTVPPADAKAGPAPQQASAAGGATLARGRNGGEFALVLPKSAWAVLAQSPDAPIPDVIPIDVPEEKRNPYPQHYK